MGHYKLGTFEREGLLVTLDAIKPTTSDEFWPSLSASLDAAHAILKETFFGLLKRRRHRVDSADARRSCRSPHPAASR